MNFLIIRRICTFIPTVFVFFSLMSISCTRKTASSTSDNETLFDTIQVNKTQSIDYKHSTLNCNLHIAFTYPITCKKTLSLSDLQKMFIEKFFPPQYAELSPQAVVDSFSSQYIRDFQSIRFNDFFDEDYILEDENNFLYELNLENEILYNQNNFISFIVKNANYEGGAQGANNIYGYVIDLNTGKFLTEEDFAGNNYKKNLSSIIVQKIAAANGMNDASQLENNEYYAKEDFVPNDNFTIDDKGITYYFNERETADYFLGTTEVFIPYKEIKTFITGDSPISSLAGL